MIFDSHAHIFPEHIVDRAMASLTERSGAQPVARATPNGLLRHMDESGVDRALVLGVATKPSQVRAINEWITSLGEPRRVPFGSLHPHAGDSADEIKRLLADREPKPDVPTSLRRLPAPVAASVLAIAGKRRNLSISPGGWVRRGFRDRFRRADREPG